MRDGVEGEKLVGMIDPEENSIVPNTKFVNALQIGWWVLNSLRSQLGMSGKAVDLLHDPACQRTVQLIEVPFKARGEFDPVNPWYLRLASSHAVSGECSKNIPRGPNDYNTEVQRVRLRVFLKSRLKSSQGRVLPDRCSRRALRSDLSSAALFTMRKSSNASPHSPTASPARSHLLYRSTGISTVWPMEYSHG